MKKWLLLAAFAAAAVLVAKKFIPMQNDNEAATVTDVIVDDTSEVPVPPCEPSPIVATQTADSDVVMPEVAPFEGENS